MKKKKGVKQKLEWLLPISSTDVATSSLRSRHGQQHGRQWLGMATRLEALRGGLMSRHHV